MRVLFHMVRKDLEIALKHYEVLKDSYYNKALDQLMLTVKYILEEDKVPKPNPGWPVSYEDACDVVSALHDQLDDAHTEISRLQEQVFKLQKEFYDLDLAPDNNGERPGRAGGTDE